MDLPLPPDDALAQPTRAQIFAFLVEGRSSFTTEEVAKHFGLHPNGVRRHLERLLEGGFVTRDRVQEGPGRPRDRWTISPDAHPGGRNPRGYAQLATWLARAIPDREESLREVERTGAEIGRELAPEPSGDPVADLRRTFAALGFRPALERDGSRLTCTLRNCPYRDSVRANSDVVCRLHRGITAGLLAVLEPGAELAGFEPHDPDRAGCRVSVELPAD